VDRDWFLLLLLDCVTNYRVKEARARLEAFRQKNVELPAKELIRRWIEHRLRATGVIYGTPLASERDITSLTPGGEAQRKAVFLAILRINTELALDIACYLGHDAPANVNVVKLLVCFALFSGEFRLADRLHALIPSLPSKGFIPNSVSILARKLAQKLQRRAYLTGNPLMGLPIHNSFNYVDAKTLGRIAVAYFEHGSPERRAVQRVLDFRDRERELLVRALVGLRRAERMGEDESTWVMLEQIEKTDLPRSVRKALQKAITGPVSPMTIAAVVSDDRTRDFVLEQVILGSMLDGKISVQEANYFADLASTLGTAPQKLALLEAQVVEFYEQHRAYLDVFTVGTTAQSFRQRIFKRLQKGISENIDLIVEEIKNTGELGELLYRASKGEKLSAEERSTMRDQMLSIVRSIPSLAIFSIPGGAVLLPLVFRYLPDGLKPRAFAKRKSQRPKKKMN
jgi:uncharacterized membrane protein YebE (DUF533 family)